jgi:hypothetical protein
MNCQTAKVDGGIANFYLMNRSTHVPVSDRNNGSAHLRIITRQGRLTEEMAGEGRSISDCYAIDPCEPA